MTLDEAIEHCLKVAERYETRAKMIDRRKLGSALENPTACHECTADHRQLAEWLMEARDLREENKFLISEFDRLIKEKGELLSKVSGSQLVKHGKWDGYICSECNVCADYFISGDFYFDEKPTFCPNCGARMDGDTEGKVNEQNIEVSRPDGNCLDCKFQYYENSNYWCSICPGNPEDI